MIVLFFIIERITFPINEIKEKEYRFKLRSSVLFAIWNKLLSVCDIKERLNWSMN